MCKVSILPLPNIFLFVMSCLCLILSVTMGSRIDSPPFLLFLFSTSVYSLCVLVCFQGDIVNNIEAQVCKAQDHIAVAKTETKKAIRYQSKARKVLHSIQHPDINQVNPSTNYLNLNLLRYLSLFLGSFFTVCSNL